MHACMHARKDKTLVSAYVYVYMRICIHLYFTGHTHQLENVVENMKRNKTLHTP